MEKTEAIFLRVRDDSFSILRHVYGENGKLLDVLPSPVFGFWMAGDKITHVVTLLGTAALTDVALWGPEGCVHAEGRIYPDCDTYTAWAKKNIQ
jgi:hypothetical protein